ncbi:hypothetical protein D918_02366 [Trichuris suis]|nr:hypothetical protein D918_02366 [Trichuris suis]
MTDFADNTNGSSSFDSRSRAFLKEMERLRNEMDELIRRRADLEQRIQEKMAELAESRARLSFLRRIQDMIYNDEPRCFCPRADVFCRCFSNRG